MGAKNQPSGQRLTRPPGAKSAFDPTEHDYPGRYRKPNASITEYPFHDADRYINWLWDKVGFYAGEFQREVLRSLVRNKRTAVIGANGPGKSYIAAAGTVSFLHANAPSVVLATSGTYSKIKRTYARPVEQLQNQAWALPGQYKQSPPRIDFDGRPETYFECASPTDSGELEGTHSAYTLAVIEEADKDAITADEIDSMRSLVTDDRDRMLLMANPPEDEANVVTEIAQPESSWNVIRVSAFEAHNVQVEMGEAEGPMINGVTSLSTIKEDWEDYNGEDWPGIEKVKEWSLDPESDTFRDNLDSRWYIRRAGITPPGAATEIRPFYIDEVQEAYNRTPNPSYITDTPTGLGLDVARMGGDFNAFIGAFGDELRVLDKWNGQNHVENKERIRGQIDSNWASRFAVDATPEGSGLADEIQEFYPKRIRFNSGEVAAQEQKYRYKWEEGLALLGHYLRNGGSINDHTLYEELAAAARTVTFEEQHYDSRGGPGGETVYSATSKSKITERLGRSPDLLDGAMMACWAASEETREEARPSVVW